MSDSNDSLGCGSLIVLAIIVYLLIQFGPLLFAIFVGIIIAIVYALKTIIPIIAIPFLVLCAICIVLLFVFGLKDAFKKKKSKRIVKPIEVKSVSHEEYDKLKNNVISNQIAKANFDEIFKMLVVDYIALLEQQNPDCKDVSLSKQFKDFNNRLKKYFDMIKEEMLLSIKEKLLFEDDDQYTQTKVKELVRIREVLNQQVLSDFINLTEHNKVKKAEIKFFNDRWIFISSYLDKHFNITRTKLFKFKSMYNIIEGV